MDSIYWLQEKPLCHQDLDVTEDLNKSSTGAIHLREIAEVILHLLPIWIALLIFAVIFQQPVTFFTKQGMTMKRNIGTTFKIPPATLQSTIRVSIILLMPLYGTLFIPFTRLLTRNEKGIGVTQRMGIGMILSVIAIVIAALVETKRLDTSRKTQSQTVPLSIFWLLPHYILLGILDIFTVVGMQQLRMRTMGIALYTSVFGVGSFLSAFIISLVEYFTQSWFSDDMSEARLDKYYWLLAMTSGLSFLTFVILCGFCKIRV